MLLNNKNTGILNFYCKLSCELDPGHWVRGKASTSSSVANSCLENLLLRDGKKKTELFCDKTGSNSAKKSH